MVHTILLSWFLAHSGRLVDKRWRLGKAMVLDPLLFSNIHRMPCVPWVLGQSSLCATLSAEIVTVTGTSEQCEMGLGKTDCWSLPSHS